MKKILLSFTLILLCITATAQTKNKIATYTIKGTLLDSLTKVGEPFSTIRISKKGAPNNPIKVLVTDTNGKFKDKISGEGTLVISFASVGKANISKEFTINPGDETIDLGTIFITDASHELKGVEVVAQKLLVKSEIDKLAYSVEDDPDSKTNNVIEMLRKVPLVTVDAEDKIQVKGSSNFKIHVNGKPNNMMSNNPTEVLKSMPASSIKSIEVITNPGAKYDAEGITGILNIITFGTMKGYTATVNAGVSNTGYNAGAYATVKSGKFTTTGNYYFGHRQSSDKSTGYSEREDFTTETNRFLTSNSSSKNKGSYGSGSMEASYEIDTLRLITFAASLYGGNYSGNSDGRTEMKNITLEPVYSYNSFGRYKSDYKSIDANIDYQRSFKRKKEELLTFSYRLSTSPSSSNYYSDYKDILNYPYQLKNSHTTDDPTTYEHTFQSDYTNPLTKNQTMEVGIKYIIRDSKTNSKYYTANPNEDVYNEDKTHSNKYDQLQDILAAYAGYNIKWKKFGFKTGLRYEYTMMDVKYHNDLGNDFSAHFSDLVPSANFSYKLSESQTLKAAYNMRISRPGIWYLNPFVNNTDPTNISYGNTDLKSEKSHSFDLNYGRFSQKFNLNLSLSHTFVNNSIERYSFIKDGVQHNTFDNIGKWATTSLSSYINWNFTPKTRLYMNGSVSYQKFNSEKINTSKDGFNYYVGGGLQQTLPWDMRFSLNGGGSGARVSLQGKGSGYNYYSVSLNKSFLEKRLTISMYASNPLSKYRKYSSTTETLQFHSYYESSYPSRSFGLNVSFRIGKLEASVKKAARSIQNNDVKSGGSGGEGK